MNKKDIEKLLGGYATGTLTAQERTLLFEAALADQSLFNALANEQALKELLDNPHARRRLLTALRAQASRPPLLSRLCQWLLPPAVRAVAGGLAVALLAVTTVTRLLDIAPSPSVVTEDAHRAVPAPGRAAPKDRRTAGKQDFTQKKSERQEPMDVLEKAAREADVQQQQKNEERRAAAAAPQPEMKLSERPSAAAAPEANRAPAAEAEAPAVPPPAAQAPAKAPVAPSPDLLARSDAARAVMPGARALFYETRPKEQASTSPGAVHELDAPAVEQQFAKSKSLSDAASRERAAGAPVRRLGLRYGLVPREEGPALVVEVNQRGYLYAAARDESGATTLVYPLLANDSQAATVEPGARYFIPSLGALSSVRLIIVLSRVPLADPAATAVPGQSGKKGALLRQETTEPPLEGVGGPTVYVVEATPSSSTLSVEIVMPAR